MHVTSQQWHDAERAALIAVQTRSYDTRSLHKAPDAERARQFTSTE